MARKRKIGEVVSNTAPKAPVSPDVTLGNQGKEVFPTDNNSLEVKNEPAKAPADPNITLGNQGSALVNATKPSGKMEPMDTKKPEKVSLTIADQKASKPVDPNATLGNQGKGLYDVSDKAPNKPVSPDTVLGNQGQDLSQQLGSENLKAQSLINAIASDVNNTVSDKAILSQIQNAETPEEINQIKADAQAAKIEEEKIKSDAANQNVNAVQQLMSGINEKLRGLRPSFDQQFTVKDVQDGIFNQYRNQTSQIPYAVVEKLGVQDYYPNVGRDIAVGTFSGSRIGSQTIYSGEGALLPMGLYDARKRALVDAAKTKQKKIDEFLKVPNAPDQFNSDFQQAAYSQLHNIGASHNWDLNAIMKDKEAMQRIYSIKNSAKELAYTDEIVDNVFESLNPKDGKTAAYVPADVLQDMIDYRQGKLDVDAVLSGKSDVLEIASRIRNYANGTAWADKNLPEWKSDPVSLPLNLRTDKEITMENLNEMNQTIERAKVSGSYDSYMTAVKKYFHLDPEVVDAWVEQNMVGATPEQKQKVIDDLNSYILAQMPPASLEQKIENLKNDNYNYWAKSGDWARQDKEKETLITRAINNAKKENIKGVISQIGNSNMTVAQKEAAMLQAYRNAGFTPVKNRSTGEIYGTINYGGAGRRGENATFTTDRSEVYLYNNKTKKYEWVNPGYALANRSKFSLKESELNELKNFQKGNALGTISETRTFETFIGTDGKPRKVSAANAKAYSNAGDKSLMMESHGNILVEGTGKDKNGAPILVPGTLKVRVALNPEKSVADRDLLDSFHMDRSQKLATDPGFDQGTTSSNFK